MASTLPYKMRAPFLTASPSRNASNPPGLPLRRLGNEPLNTEYIRMPLGTRSRKFFHWPFIHTWSMRPWMISSGTTRPCSSSISFNLGEMPPAQKLHPQH